MKNLFVSFLLLFYATAFGQTISYTLKSAIDSSAIQGLQVKMVLADEHSKILATRSTNKNGVVVFDTVAKGRYELLCDTKDWTSIPQFVVVKNKKAQEFNQFIDISGARKLASLSGFYLSDKEFWDTLKAYEARSIQLTPTFTLEDLDPLNKTVTSTLKYSNYCVENGIEGKVYLKLLVDETNTILHITVMRSPDIELSALAVQAFYTIKKLPLPASTTKGHLVFFYPVTFKLT